MSNQVMIVDDEEGLRQLLGIMLIRAGFSVIAAQDGESALKLLETEHPDAFILDVMMPGMDGFDLCRTIRQRPALAGAPILILSGRTDPESVDEGLNAGATRYMLKPILTGKLVAEIRALLA